MYNYRKYSENINFDTPLHIAVCNNDEECVSELLILGAETCVKNENGSTPLHLAVYNGNANIIKLLLKYNADIFAKDINGNIPLHLASRNSSIEVVQILLKEKRNGILIKNSFGSTPLHLAVRAGNIDIVRELLIRGSNINSRNKNGKTAFDLAKSMGNREIEKLLELHSFRIGPIEIGFYSE